jgi:hypothetical protein
MAVRENLGGSTMLPESRVAVCEPFPNALRLYDIYAEINSGERFVRTAEGMLPLSELRYFLREELIPPRVAS